MTCKHCGKQLLPDQMGFCSDVCIDTWHDARRMGKAGREKLQAQFDRWLEKLEGELKQNQPA